MHNPATNINQHFFANIIRRDLTSASAKAHHEHPGSSVSKGSGSYLDLHPTFFFPRLFRASSSGVLSITKIIYSSTKELCVLNWQSFNQHNFGFRGSWTNKTGVVQANAALYTKHFLVSYQVSMWYGHIINHHIGDVIIYYGTQCFERY